MAKDLMRFVQRCSAEKGIALTGSETNVQDLTRTLSDSQHDELSDCVADGVRELYPDVSSVAFP
jgi:hypothetical protein